MLYTFNQIIDYIDEHLDEEITKHSIENIAGTSEYHFRRMFAYLTGISLTEYIRKRRLARANEDRRNGEKVITVAFKYAYQSTDGFSRAFKEWSGYSPSEIFKNRAQLFFPKLAFNLKVEGGITMEVKIERKEKFNIISVEQTIPIQFKGVHAEIIKLAQSITEQQRAEMHLLGNLYPNRVINALYAFDQGRMHEIGTLKQVIGFLSSEENGYPDLIQLAVESNLWAVFPVKGVFPNKLQETWANIFSTWLPASEFELVDAPEISFTNYDTEGVEKYSEIWIAVRKMV